MALQNIGAGNKNDAFYRYKMPKMLTKIEGRGNGIKTNIVNMVEIAKALGRPPSYTTKYFGCELGAQSKFDEKTGTSHVNGSHDTSKLAGILENFIKKYVQCYGCGNPETEVIISKSQMITLKCIACGFISDVDMRDKLTSFIIKNPPESKKGSKDKKAMRKAEKERIKEGEAADEEQRKMKKEATNKKKLPKKPSPEGSQADEKETVDVVDDDVQWLTDTSAAAARQRIQEQLSAVTANMVMLSTEEDHHLVKLIKECMKKNPTMAEFKAFINSLTKNSPKEIMDALFETMFNGISKGFSKEVIKNKKYIITAIGECSRVLILESIEDFCLKTNREASKEIALVLKGLYDEDILEEEIIVEWYEKGLVGRNKGKAMWKNVKPFIDWLQSAESESEDE